MRSWLAQSLRALEDMVDSGELTEEELAALAKSALMPSVSTIPPGFAPSFEESFDELYDREPPESAPADRSGTHPAQPSTAPASAAVPATGPASHRSGTMPRAEAPRAKASTKR
jgi:hypothetical protein